MPVGRKFITTGSTSSLRDVIEDVFASSSISEAGKNRIEAETTDFYKGVIINCSSQYSAEGVIEAANVIMASYLRNRYRVEDLDIPDISGSRQIPTIGEINNLISGAFYEKFSGSVDDWWGKKWNGVSEKIILSSSFKEEWHKIYDPISGNLVTSGSFPRHWHGLYDPISGTLITSGNFERKWHNLFDPISSSIVTSGSGWGRSFSSEWSKKWDPISGNLIVSGTPGFGHRFDDEWAMQWNPRSGSYILGSEFDSRWTTRWNGVSGSCVSATEFDTKWNTKWNSVSGSFISSTDVDKKLSGSLDTFKTVAASNLSESRLIHSSSLTMVDTKLSSSLDLVKFHVTNSINLISSSNAYAIKQFGNIRDEVTSSNAEAIRQFEGFRNEVTISNSSSRAIFESASRATSASNAAAVRQFELVRDIVTASNNEAIGQFSAFKDQVLADNATTRTYVTASNEAVRGHINTVYSTIESNLSQSIAYVNTVVSDVTGSQPTQMPNWQKIAGWIYNGGSAFLDIDFESSKGFRIECMAEWPIKAPAVNYLVARKRADNPYIDGFMIRNGDTPCCQLGGSPAILTANEKVVPEKRFNLEMSNLSGGMYISINKEKVAASGTEGSPENKGSVFVMAANCLEDPNEITPGDFRLYYMKVYSASDKLIANLWPAIDQKNGIPCMYDYVSGQYIYNKGTGNFTVSDEVQKAWG